METYRMIRNEISVKNMLETVDSLSGWERLSGSKQEMEAAHYLEGRLQSFGYDVKIDLCDAYISLPLEAVLQVDSKPMRAQTHSLVPTAHVKAPMIFCENEADIARTNCCGKIVLTPGRAVFGPVEAAQRTGAVGAIFIQEAVIRECIPSACWGSPTMGDWDLLPSIPVASVVDTDAEKIVQAVREGKTVVADLATKTDTSWRKIPLLIAELKAPCKTDQFVQFAGHLDSWYYGAIDNGTGNAVQLEVARIAALHKNELKRNLRIVYYSGHSHGRYAGSAWYADHYWEDLYNNCAVNVNTDCPGCKGAEDIAHSIVMPEAKPLAIQIVRDQTGELFEGKRCGRLGDQSFWNVGVSSAFASFSRQKRKTIVAARSTTDTGPSTEGFERGNSELGPGWHTPMDLPMYIDQDNLLRDARIVGEYVLTCITSDVLPLRMEEESGEIVEKLQAWSDMANGTFDLSKSLKYARELHEKVKVFMDASIPAARKNDAIMKLGRLLIPVNFTRGNIYGTEPALPISAVPALEPIRKLVAKEMTEVNRMAVKVELVRAVNFINHSLKQAIDVTDAALEGINA